MFYSQFILAKKGPLGTIWIAAHLERKLRKNQVADTDIGVFVAIEGVNGQDLDGSNITVHGSRGGDYGRGEGGGGYGGDGCDRGYGGGGGGGPRYSRGGGASDGNRRNLG